MRVRATLGVACVLALGIGTAAAQEAKIAVSEVSITHKVSALGASKGDHYVNVSFVAKLNDNIVGDKKMKIAASCKAGERTVSDEMTAFDVKLKTMKVGDATPATAPLFVRSGLKDKPSACDLTFVVHEFGKKLDDTLAKFCYVDGKVVEGACK
jgi:hypothetical protein